MKDLIERQAAIDALRTCYDTEAITHTNGNEYIDYDQALDLINTLPSAQPKQPEQQWIPCSERLPEHAGVYLVTTIVAVDKYVITSWYSTKGGWICEDRPEAWMPLPEPYREDDHETD